MLSDLFFFLSFFSSVEDDKEGRAALGELAVMLNEEESVLKL
jgi:hypothetical protein